MCIILLTYFNNPFKNKDYFNRNDMNSIQESKVKTRDFGPRMIGHHGSHFQIQLGPNRIKPDWSNTQRHLLDSQKYPSIAVAS